MNVTAEELVQGLCQAMACQSKHDVENEEWVLDVVLEGGRGQEITVRPFEEEEQAFVRFFTAIGKAAEFTLPKLKTALELNASLRHGAVALYEGEIVLTETASLLHPLEEITRVARYLTRMADAYEKILFGVDRA